MRDCIRRATFPATDKIAISRIVHLAVANSDSIPSLERPSAESRDQTEMLR